ncbi:MAG: helix-turn-helix domain-containing protein [Defluviitaleaceae bacterium]|nr:helix-turn-helix domain-containing protein [Defluviitaleaceae bacterium]MCL2835617.1 helix-turn-helix domain-containing protein [Defluviitaleaceae bacterium]
MLKVMLADSDAENIRNFRTYIKMAFPDIKITGYAAPDKDFIGQVKEQDPNLIIADIHFLGTGALQKLRDVYEFFPDKRFILYGTYNDAEYMEKSGEYGVINYIYRPVKPGDLEKSLHHALKVFAEILRVETERRKLVEQYHDNIEMFRDRFLNNLTKGHLTDESEIMQSLNYFNIRLTPGYCVFTVRIDHFKKIILTIDEMEKYLLVYKILLIINEGLKRIGSGAAVVNRLNTVSVILGGNLPLLEAIKFCDGLRLDIQHQARTNVTIGLGRVYNNVRDIAVSYRESESALRYRHYMGYNTVIPIQFVEPMNNITYRYPLEKEERLVYSAVTGEYESCRELLGGIFKALRACGPLPDKLIPKIIMDILFRISRFASEQNMNIDDRFTTFFPSKEVIALDNLEDAYVFLNTALKSFCSYIIKLKEEYNARLVAKVKDYINENYGRNIPISSLAAQIGATPEFLVEIFRKAEGMNIYQYAIDLRIKKAAALMQKQGMSVLDAAKEVGYDDVKYFNAVFKQLMGMTADEYRKASQAP